ncbi:hypothetical protein LJC56_10020 [Christensenellaceae bacterium OttesenSCG-928-K19]|nr:hypothetical protein [Christensenellaceae bacterium OttesenSCG-928-K19]
MERYRRRAGRTSYRWNKKRTLFIVLVIVAVVVVLLLFAFGVFGKSTISQDALEAGELPAPAPTRVVEDLADKGEAEPNPSDFHYEINGTPVFSGGGGKGNLGIENPSDNYYAMHVEIVSVPDGERLYSSGILAPGESIPEDSLLVWLGKGEHYATANIFAYDPETNEQVAQTTAGLTITVE